MSGAKKVDGFPRLLLAGIGHQQDWRPDLAGELRVEVELEGGRDTGEVGSLAEHEVAASFQLLVPGEDALHQLLGTPRAGQLTGRLVVDTLEGLVGGGREIAAPNQLGVVVQLVPGPDDGPEEAELLDAGREQLHHPEHGQRLSAPRLDGGDVEVSGHSSPSVRQPARPAQCHSSRLRKSAVIFPSLLRKIPLPAPVKNEG